MSTETQDRILSRCIPKGSTAANHTLGTAYYLPANGGKVHALGYCGTAGKHEWNYLFKDQTAADDYIARWFANLEQRAASKKQRAAERMAAHTIPVGAIIVNSWGYDQTNVDFYQVVKATRNFVFLRRIQSEISPGGGSSMSGNAVALKDKFKSEEITQHRASASNHVNFEFGSGNVWDGRPEYVSWYA